jgi:hypothetical protein
MKDDDKKTIPLNVREIIIDWYLQLIESCDEREGESNANEGQVLRPEGCSIIEAERQVLTELYVKQRWAT